MCILFISWEPRVPVLWSGNPYEVIMQKQIFKLSIQTAVKICVCQTITLKIMLYKSCFCLTYIFYTKTCTSFWPYGTSRSGHACPCNLFLVARKLAWCIRVSPYCPRALPYHRVTHTSDKRNFIRWAVLWYRRKFITWND